MTTLMDPTLRGSGKISGVFFSAANDVVAVASAFSLLINPRARAAYGSHALRYRVALYRQDALVPFAAFDDLRYPVNDVAFHPDGTTILIGGGSYDGGYLFEGDLVVWDWRNARATRPFKHVPEVVRCRYNAAGDQIEAWMRPWDEEWGAADDNADNANDADDADNAGDADNTDDAFDTLYLVQTPAPGGTASPARDLELDPAAIAPKAPPASDLPSPVSRLKAWFGVQDWTSRDAITDIAALDDGLIAVAHRGCLLEIYRRNGERIAAYAGPGHGAEILKSAGVRVHVVETTQRPPNVGRQDSRLYALTEDGLQQTHAYEGELTFSSTPNGRVLGRQNRFHLAGTRARDVLLDVNTGVEQRVDLGHYDCFNHYLNIRGAPYLFMLQGTPASSHENKVLCIVEPDGAVRRLWPLLKADRKPASHAMELCGAYVDDALGPGVVISGKHYCPNVTTPYAGFIYRKPLDRDREVWRRSTPASASAIVALPHAGLIVAAFLDGSLQAIDAQSGALRRNAKVHMDGLPTIIFAMDADDDTLLMGTVDGRIAQLRISALCQDANGETEESPTSKASSQSANSASILNLN